LGLLDLSMSEARGQLDALARRAASGQERVTITEAGRPAAVIVSAVELADLEDDLALARYDAKAARGDTVGVLQAEARLRLGLPRA
jgi:prevent-host-death family protein